VLRFNTKCLRFTANPDDNTMMVRGEDASSLDTLGWTCLDCKEPWQSLIARSFGGGWVTINQQGSCDGVLLSFNGMQPTIMLGVVGSSLTINRIIDEHDAARRSFLAGRPALLAEREHKPTPPFEIPYPSPRRASLRPREQVFRNPWAKRAFESPYASGVAGEEPNIKAANRSRPGLRSSITAIGRVVWFTLTAAFACALVGAVGSLIGSLIGAWLGAKFFLTFAAIAEIGNPVALWSLGLLIGILIGVTVGAYRERSMRMASCGAVVGALGFIVSSMTIGRPMHSLVGWAILGLITGGSYCAFLTLLKGCNRLASKTGSVARVMAYTVFGSACSTLVAALSYLVGNLIGMRLRPGQNFLDTIDPIVTASDRFGWGWTGAILGTIVGVSVGAIRQKPVVGLGFLGAIVGALVFIVANPRTTSSVMDGSISSAIIAGVGGLIACGISGFAKALKKLDGDTEQEA
jgi:hypothetical protein